MTERKRPAYEPAARLLERTRYDPDMRRPLATVAGAALVLLRVVAGMFWLGAVVLQVPDLVATSQITLDAASDAQAASLGITVVLVVGGVGLLVEALLAFLIYRGVNWARVLVMGFSVVSISFSFAAWWAEDQEITINTTFVTLAFDILVLLALSSRDAAAYARRNEGRPPESGR